MKILLALLFVSQACLAQEAFFFEIDRQKKPTVTIKKDAMIITKAIRRVKPPKALEIIAFRGSLGPGREYQIQVDLAERTKDGWIPKMKLGSDIVVEGVIVSRYEKGTTPDAFHIENSDKDKIVKWVKLLSKLLQVENDNITIDLEGERIK